jgi:hypothetical protein
MSHVHFTNPEVLAGLRHEYEQKVERKLKNPGPAGAALVYPGGVTWVITFTSGVQVSGFGINSYENSRGRAS